MRLYKLANKAETPLISLVFSLLSLISVTQAQIQTFVQTGDPTANTGTTFNRFGLPSLNNAGQVVYFASLNGVSVTDFGIYRSLIPIPGADQVVRAGDPAPGGGVFIKFSNLFTPPLAITSAGETTFTAMSDNVTAENDIFGFSSTGTGNRFVAAGNTSPNGNGVLDGPNRFNVNYNDNGQVAFDDTLSGTSGGRADDEGVFRTGTAPGSLVQIVREGDPVPDGNGTFGESLAHSSTAFGIPSVNNAGTVAFGAGVTGSNTQIPGHASSFDAGIFTGNDGSIVQIARAGQTGIPANGAFVAFLSEPVINNHNQVAFAASSQVGTIVNDAIYRKEAGTFIEIAHAGEALPGGGFITAVSDAVQMNDAGQVASLISTNSSPNLGSGGIIRGNGGLLTVMARNGEGTPRGGATIMSSFSGQSFAMNALGDMAFTALLDTNPNDVVSSDSKGLFLYGDRFGLLEIAQKGDPLNGSTITDLTLAGTGASDGSGVSALQMGLNDEDQVVFRFDLANGKEGISVWSIPEPSPIFLLILSGVCLIFLRSGQQMLSFVLKRS
jgi:hypothetical protein